MAPADGVSTDLVEYMIVVVRDVDSLAPVAMALADMTAKSLIRILDLVIVARHADHSVEVLELETVPSMAPLTFVQRDIGRLLSERDIKLASEAVDPESAAIILVTEDRWARPLADAARDAGGLIVAGERIPKSRIEAALGEPREGDTKEA